MYLSLRNAQIAYSALKDTYNAAIVAKLVSAMRTMQDTNALFVFVNLTDYQIDIVKSVLVEKPIYLVLAK
jgi:hypothetical protein